MNGKLNYSKIFLSFILLILSFYINYYYANKGVYPIDSFSFFDSAFYVTEGQHPIKDFWVISGILLDYVQAIFFFIFGINWNAYIFHASFFNSIITLFFFFFLNQFNKNLFFNFCLSASVAILCYPIIGTPFPYQHSLILSLISLFLFYLGVEKEKSIYWIILPAFMLLSFLSMQLPAGLINLILMIFLIIYYIFYEKYFVKYFLFGSLFAISLFTIYLIITQINLSEFIYQIILFPLSVGEGRIMGDQSAFESAKLLNKITLRGTIGHFKFINFFILLNLIFMFIYFKKKLNKSRFDKVIFLNLLVFFCSICFIFHQLITANQTFIFSLIPILCGFVTIQIYKTNFIKNTKIFSHIFLIIIIFSTFKYHNVYNEKRKFVDLQNVNLSNALPAKILNSKFNNLNWITPNHFEKKPKIEIDLLKNSMQVLENDQSSKMLITHYQFISAILNENLNIPNRWYYPNNTFPSSSQNKYYENYLKGFEKKIKINKIVNLYVLESFPGEFSFLNLNDLLGSDCFQKEKLNEIFYRIKISKC